MSGPIGGNQICRCGHTDWLSHELDFPNHECADCDCVRFAMWHSKTIYLRHNYPRVF